MNQADQEPVARVASPVKTDDFGVGSTATADNILKESRGGGGSRANAKRAVLTGEWTCATGSQDIRFMREALKEAQKAFERDEVPVGAILVHQNAVIARGHNQVELLQDATAHAEMLCITAATTALGNWRLTGTTLYCTLEPCAMCAGALLAARVERLVWGAPDLRLGAGGSWIDLFAHKHPMHALTVTSGVLAEEAAFLMKRFFEQARTRDRSDR